MNRDLLNAVLAVLVFSSASMAQNTITGDVADTTLANRYFARAEKLVASTKPDSAGFYFEKAGAIYEKAANKTGALRYWEQYVKCYNNLGDYFRMKGQTETALRYFNKALKTGLDKLGENHLEVAKTHHGIGVLYLSQNDAEPALRHFNAALAVRLQMLGEEHLEVAKSYNNIGIAYDIKGDDDKALKNHEKSLAIKLKLLGEKNAEAANSYNNIGNVLRDIGDYDAALAYLNKALSIRQQLFGENHSRVGSTYLNLGGVYALKGDYDLGIACYKKSLDILIKTVGENEVVGGIYNNLGHVYRQKLDYPAALENLDKALAVWKKVLGENHPDVGRVYFNFGRVYVLNADYDQALANYEKCLALWKTAYGEKHPDVGELYALVAQAYLRKNDLVNALTYYQKSIIALSADFTDESIYSNPLLKNISSKSSLLDALEYKAEALQKLFSTKSHDLKDLRMSLSSSELASDLIDQIRNDYKEEGSKLTLGEKAAPIYEKAIHGALLAYGVTKQMQHQTQAFFFAEKSKAAVLSQALQESNAKQFAGIPADLLENERNLRIDLAFYETELQKEKLKTEKQDSAKIRDFEGRRFSRKREYENLIAQLEKSYPKYYALKYKTQTASVPELQKSLDGATALLEYFLGDSSIFAFAVTKDDFAVISMPRDSSFNSMMTALSTSFKNLTSKAAYLRSASRLYEILAKPFEPQIASKLRWVIIPDGELYQIPFEALLTGTVSISNEVDYRKLPYLIKQHEISYHYSATLFLQNRQAPTSDAYVTTFVGFAPVFSKSSQNGNFFFASLTDLISSYLKTRDGKTLDELKHSEQEVRDILATFSNKGRVYLHGEASEENFKKNIAGYKYVHVATHGIIIGENPKLSNLAFSQPKDRNAPEDGFLYSGETYNLNLNADLVTLSSCESGIGKLAKGEGVMALTRGFLYSGANNIIASLWKVLDEHTSKMMVELYRQILAGKNYSAALREAKLKMIANAATAGPQSWASFVLIGR